MSIVRIENNTARFIRLPPTDSFYKGVSLLPGLNSVPKLYLEELESYSVPAVSPRGTPLPDRFPGREALAKLQEPVLIVTVDGRRTGPQITIHQDPLAGQEDGPRAPEELPKNVDAAKALINVTTDKAALKRWSKDRRSEVASAAANKLNGVVS